MAEIETTRSLQKRYSNSIETIILSYSEMLIFL